MDKAIADFMERYSVLADELWQVRPGTYAVKHKALERLAVENGIEFEQLTILAIDLKEKMVAVSVTGSIPNEFAKDRRRESSTGEAAPYNNKNGYPVAMAEKRARDRVTLKLLSANVALYSEAEADEFKELGSNGQPTSLAKKDAKEIYTKMQGEIRDCQSREQLKSWMTGNKDRIEILPEDWRGTLRLQCEEMLADLRQREAA